MSEIRDGESEDMEFGFEEPNGELTPASAPKRGMSASERAAFYAGVDPKLLAKVIAFVKSEIDEKVSLPVPTQRDEGAVVEVMKREKKESAGECKGAEDEYAYALVKPAPKPFVIEVESLPEDGGEATTLDNVNEDEFITAIAENATIILMSPEGRYFNTESNAQGVEFIMLVSGDNSNSIRRMSLYSEDHEIKLRCTLISL